MTQPMPREPHEGIKADAGPESEAAEADQTSYVARGGQTSGIINPNAQPGDEHPVVPEPGGSAAGDALSGVTGSPEDLDDAVSGDTGPEHPGVRS